MCNTKMSDTKSHDKKKSSRIPKESNIAEDKMDKINILTTLREKYQCTIHNNKYCYIQENHHLNLTPIHLKLWTAEIVSIILFINYYFLFIINNIINYNNLYRLKMKLIITILQIDLYSVWQIQLVY